VFNFVQQNKGKSKFRIALWGETKTGKTTTALKLASQFGEKILVIDTENDASAMHADDYNFDVLDPPLQKYSPVVLANLIIEAQKTYDVLLIDSLSEFWAGVGGAMEMLSKATSSFGGNSFFAWSKITPVQNKMVRAILNCSVPIICTMESKDVYEVAGSGQQFQVSLTGTVPNQRKRVPYIFNVLIKTSTREKGKVFNALIESHYRELHGLSVDNIDIDWIQNNILTLRESNKNE